MKDYEKLKQVIQQANPEIMELKFGCEIHYEMFPMRTIRTGIAMYGVGNKEICVMHEGLIPDFIYEKRDLKKILGRPIRLADVLLALQSNTRIEKTVLMMNLPGTFAYSDAEHHVIARWNLKNDNFEHQSDHTKQFLIELLVNK